MNITDNKTTDPPNDTQKAALANLNTEVSTLYSGVSTDATNAKGDVENLAVALGANPKAEELRDKEKKIDAAIKFADNGGAFLNGFLEAKKQYDLLVALKEQRQSLDTGESLPQDTLKLKLDQLDAAIAAQQNTIFFGTKSED